MLKTFEESSAGKMLTMYWKRFAVSGTVFVHKYRTDPLFRTEVRIIALQVLTLLVLLVIIAVTAAVVLRRAPEALGDFIRASAAVLAILALFAYVISRIALAPVRKVIESQKEFIGNVAHELRTPLSIIKADTEVALMSSQVSPELESTLKSTLEELDRTSETIDFLITRITPK